MSYTVDELINALNRFPCDTRVLIGENHIDHFRIGIISHDKKNEEVILMLEKNK